MYYIICRNNINPELQKNRSLSLILFQAIVDTYHMLNKDVNVYQNIILHNLNISSRVYIKEELEYNNI